MSQKIEQLEALVIAAVRLAIARHDLCDDEGDSFPDVIAQEIAEDTAAALQGEGTCDTQPAPEWIAALASHAPSASPDICEKCGQEVIDGHWSLVCHKPACIKALQEEEVSMSYDLPVKRCFNLEDHSEHSWEYQGELHKCPGMPIQPSEAAAQPTCVVCGHPEHTDEHAGISHLPVSKAHAFKAEIEHNDH